jgi:hypothetical protein
LCKSATPANNGNVKFATRSVRFRDDPGQGRHRKITANTAEKQTASISREPKRLLYRCASQSSNHRIGIAADSHMLVGEMNTKDEYRKENSLTKVLVVYIKREEKDGEIQYTSSIYKKRGERWRDTV